MKLVVTFTTKNPVVAGTTVDDIVPIVARHMIVLFISIHIVVAIGAGEIGWWWVFERASDSAADG